MMKKIFAAFTLFIFSSLSADITIDSTRVTTYHYACVDAQDNILSKHTVPMEASAACATRKLNNPDGEYSVIGGRWRIDVAGALAQSFVGESPVAITGITSGNVLSTLTDKQSGGTYQPGNQVYADVTGGFDLESIPLDFVDVNLIRTKASDSGSMSADIVQLTVSEESQVCVWHSACVVVKPGWLTSEYALLNESIGISSVIFGDFDAYCGLKNGALGFDGNTTDGDTLCANYFITISKAYNQVPTAVVPSGNGEFSFVTTAETISESSSGTVARVLRSNGNTGAVSVDVIEGAGSTCAAPDTTFTDPTTINWAAGIDGDGGGVAITTAAISSDCTVDFEFDNESGGIVAGASNQNNTLTVDDIPASAGDYFVGKDGSDGNSCSTAQTIGTPKLTIAAGIGCLSAGNTLVVKAGTYAEQNLGNAIPNGTSWSNVTTLRENGSDVVIIRPPGTGDGNRCFFFGGSQTINIKAYIELQGFECDGKWIGQNQGPGIGENIKVEGRSHHLRFNGLELHSVGESCLAILSPGGWAEGVGGHEVINNDIHDCGLDPNSGFSPFGHGLYFSHDNSKIWGNDIHDNTGWGFHIYSAPAQTDNNDIQYNRAWGNGYLNPQGFGIVVDGDDNLIANNIFYENFTGQIQVYNGHNNNRIINNTIYDSAGGVGIQMRSGVTNTLIKNNIIYMVTGTDTTGGSGTTLTTNFTTDPSFTDPGTTASSDYTIPNSSAACDAGTTDSEVTDDFLNISRPQETNYAIGAYECSP